MNAILANLSALSTMLGTPISAAALTAQALRDAAGRVNWRSVQEVLSVNGLDSHLSKRALRDIPQQALPVVLTLQDEQAAVLTHIRQEQGEHIYTLADGEGPSAEMSSAELSEKYLGFCWFLKLRAQQDRRSELPEYTMPKAWLLRVLWRYRSYYAQAVVATVVVNLLALIGSLYVMQVYDRVIPNRAFETLWALTIGTLGAIGFEFLARTVRAELTDVAGKKADLVISAALFRRVMALDLGGKPASSGSYANNLRDFEAVREFLTSSMLLALVDLPFVLLYIGVIFFFAGPLGWVPLAMVPLIVGASLLVQIPLAKATRESMKEASQRQGLAVEAIEGLETLKTHNATTWAQQLWERANAATSHAAQKSKRISSLLMSGTQTLQQLATVFVVLWGVHLIHHDNQAARISMGALIAAVILTGRAIGPMGQVAGLLARLNQTHVALQGIDSIIKRPSERDASRDYCRLNRIDGQMQAQHLSFRYDKAAPVAALDDINLSFKPGEKVAILGRIGSGKSTLLRCLAGLYEPQQGMVLVDGINVRQLDPTDLRNGVTLLGQSPRLFMGTLRDNLELARMDQLGGDDALLAALKRFGLDHLVSAHATGLGMPIGEDGQGLSGGQKQLLGLVRLTLRNPRVVLLDEPTSGLDQGSETAALRALAQWAQERTLVVVTHRPQVLDIVNRVVVMDNGKVLLDGPKAEVLKALAQGIALAPPPGAALATGAAKPAVAPAQPKVTTLHLSKASA
jgi:ATP-binding cassette, subfamily C, bacterial LapB